MTQLTSQSESVLNSVDAARSTGWARVADFVQLAKPRITVMVVITSYIGFAMATHDQGGQLTDGTLAGSGRYYLFMAAALIGTALCCMAASVFNQYKERDVDALMRRTQDRPLPAGRVAPGAALWYALIMGVLGVGILFAVNPLAGALAVFTIVSYAWVYTPMKRLTHLSTIVGAAPGAMPPILGYAAASGRIGAPAWLLFAIMFLWQLPHFLAIAWLYREDYARANLPVLPVVDPDGRSTFRQILIGCLALVPLGLLPTLMGVSGMTYFFGSLIAGVAFLGFAVALVIGRSSRHARAMFFASLVYLPIVLALMMVDRI